MTDFQKQLIERQIDYLIRDVRSFSSMRYLDKEHLLNKLDFLRRFILQIDTYEKLKKYNIGRRRSKKKLLRYEDL